MDRLIFIVGQGHSGSTLLDMLLSSGGKAVSLGQIATVAKRSGDRIVQGQCSCGRSAIECDFWGPVLSEFVELGVSASLEDKYRIVMDQVGKLYGPEMNIIDSSKHVETLQKIEDFANFEVAPIHMVKDVRSYAISMIDKNAVRKRRASVFAPEKVFIGWYRQNLEVSKYLKKSSNYENFRVVYEELVFKTEAMVGRINEYLGDSYIDLEGSFNSHIISGNRMKNKIVKPREIRYDFRWLARSEWLRPYVLMPFVSRYNKSLYEIFKNNEVNKLNILYQND